MFNRKSSYALNKKDPNAIVYMDANEAIIRLTREDFASEKEFLKWKALSDEDYHASEKEAHVYANHTLALDELSEEAASIPAVDVCMEQAHDRAEAIHRSVRKVTQIRKHLTDTQFRRVWMYFVDGMTVDEIGAAEGVSHQNISKSIGAAIVARQFFCETRTEFLRKNSPVLRSKSETRSLASTAPKMEGAAHVKGRVLAWGGAAFAAPPLAFCPWGSVVTPP